MKRARIRTSRRIKTFGQWAVTAYGVECLESFYPIEKERLWQADWKRHVCAKRWVIAGDFCEAIDYAREYHRQPCTGDELDPYGQRR